MMSIPAVHPRPQRRLRHLLGTLMGTALAMQGCSPAPDATIVLRYASPYTPTHPLSQADQRWIRHVQAASAGRLRIVPSWAGSLISSDHNMIELRHGVADIATVSPIYSRGGTQAIRMQAGFYGGERSIRQQVGVYRCLQARFPVLRAEMHGLVPLAFQGGNVLALITRARPVRRLEDLRGLRIRVPSEIVALMRSLGADPLDMPMADVYPAMAKGVIDGVVAPADTLHSLHFGEVARYFNLLRISRGAYPARAISARAMLRLPGDLRRVLLASQPFWEQAVSEELRRAERSGTAYGKSQGMTFVDVTPAAQRRFDGLYNAQAASIARDGDGDLQGPAMFRTAQALVAQTGRGAWPACTHVATAAR